MMMAVPEARPWKPSMMLKAFARPANTKTVNAMETSGSARKPSTTAKSRRVTALPVTMQKTTPESIVATSRRLAETFLVRSSANPVAKAIALPMAGARRRSRTGGRATAAAASSPA